MTPIHSHRYPNGLTLLVEPLEGVASVGLTWLLPAGAVHEPSDRLGVAGILSEMIFRGAGDLDARAHSDALDRLGVRRASGVETHHLRLGARLLGDRLDRALPLVVDMVLRPRLPEEALEPCVQLGLQTLDGLEDHPQERVMLELKRRHWGEPIGRSVHGEAEHLRRMGLVDVQSHRERGFVPEGSILALSGAVDPEQVRAHVGELVGDWRGTAERVPATRAPGAGSFHHIEAETAQHHIGLACGAVPPDDPESMTQRLAVAVLSGGMSGRLFTEVREKRGLCYSVHATYAAQPGAGTLYAYAGTTVARAAETLEVLGAELQRLGAGVEPDEFDRAVVGLKARVVMQGESTGARARALARDQFLLGRARTLDEVRAEIEAVDLARLNAFVAAHRPGPFTTLTIGPEPLVATP